MKALIRQRAEWKGEAVEVQVEEYRRRNLLHVGPIPPKAVAESALFLASERAQCTTGIESSPLAARGPNGPT